MKLKYTIYKWQKITYQIGNVDLQRSVSNFIYWSINTIIPRHLQFFLKSIKPRQGGSLVVAAGLVWAYDPDGCARTGETSGEAPDKGSPPSISHCWYASLFPESILFKYFCFSNMFSHFNLILFSITELCSWRGRLSNGPLLAWALWSMDSSWCVIISQ